MWPFLSAARRADQGRGYGEPLWGGERKRVRAGRRRGDAQGGEAGCCCTDFRAKSRGLFSLLIAFFLHLLGPF